MLLLVPLSHASILRIYPYPISCIAIEQILREEISRLEDELEKLRGMLVAHPPPPPQPHVLYAQKADEEVGAPIADLTETAVGEFAHFFLEAIDKGTCVSVCVKGSCVSVKGTRVSVNSE